MSYPKLFTKTEVTLLLDITSLAFAYAEENSDFRHYLKSNSNMDNGEEDDLILDKLYMKIEINLAANQNREIPEGCLLR